MGCLSFANFEDNSGFQAPQKAQYNQKTFNDIINNLYILYTKNILKFILFHSSLLYVIYISFEHTLFNIWTISIILTKLCDLGIKLYLFKKINNGGYFNIEDYGVNNSEVDWKIKYLSVFIYTGLFIPAVF